MNHPNVVSEAHIRLIRNNDHSALQNLSSSLLVERVHLSTTKSKVAKFVGDPKEIMLVAIINEKIIGVISAGKLSSLPETSRWLELFVNSNWRGRGIGKLLLQSLISQCGTNENIQCLVLSVKRNNKTAIDLYLKHGFTKRNNFTSLFFPIVDMYMLTNTN